jgi:type II secretory pathway component PulJ
MSDEVRRYIEDLQRHIQHRDQEIQRLQWQLQQVAEQLRAAQSAPPQTQGVADGQTARQINDLKRENRDLRIKLLDLENQAGVSGGSSADPSQLLALQQQVRDLEAALQRAHASAPSHPAAPSRDLFDPIISSLESALSQLRRGRDASPSAPSSPSAGPDHADLIGQVRDLERMNRQLERDLERAQSSPPPQASAPSNDAELQALRQKLSLAERQLHDLSQANLALEAQAASSASSGADRQQLNTLKRENRDLRMALDEARAGDSPDASSLHARIQELEASLRQSRSGGSGGGADPRLHSLIASVSSTAEDLFGQWRGDMRALQDHTQELRKLSDIILDLPGSTRSSLEEVDLSLTADALDDFIQGTQNTLQKLKDSLRPLRDASS